MPDFAETPPASGNDRFNNTIAIIVALISAFLAVSKIKDDNVIQAIQRAQALTVDFGTSTRRSACGSSSSTSRCSAPAP